MIMKKFYLSLVVFIAFTICGSGMVEAMGMYGQPPMQQPYGMQSPNAMHHQNEINKLQNKKMMKPHKAAKYDEKIRKHQKQMAKGK